MCMNIQEKNNHLTKTSQPGTVISRALCHVTPHTFSTLENELITGISPFSTEEQSVPLISQISPVGTENVVKINCKIMFNSVQTYLYNFNNMILPLLKVVLNNPGEDEFSTQIPDSSPPMANHLDPSNAVSNIPEIIGDHEFLDDIAWEIIEVKIQSLPGEVTITRQDDQKLISFPSSDSFKLLSTILTMMKQPTMMKKYFESHTLYIGQESLQVFGNIGSNDSWAPSSMSPASSPKAILGFGDYEDSDDDSGVGRMSPIRLFEDDLSFDENEQPLAANPEENDNQFTMLWYGTDDSNADPDGNAAVNIYSPNIEGGIFPDFSPADICPIHDEDNIDSENDDEEDDVILRISIISSGSVDKDEDIIADIPITSVSLLTPSQDKAEFNSLCQSFSNIKLGHPKVDEEYIENNILEKKLMSRPRQ